MTPLRLVSVALGTGVLLSTVADAQRPNSRPPQATPPQPSVPARAGSYLVGIVALGDTTWSSWNLRVQGDSVFVTGATAASAMKGRARPGSVVLEQFWDSTAVRARFEGVTGGDFMEGRALGARRGSAVFADTAFWFARRTPDRVGAPRRVTLDPKTFYRTFASSHTPALRIFPGDTVETRTVDAGGVDWNGVARTAGGNPQTGPFYVEGALPGDVIAIRLHKVRLNRDFANAGTSLVGSAITTGLARGLPDVPNFSGRWTLDRERGVARLSTPTAPLAGYSIPLRPMLGCIAVAPARGQAIRTQDSGPFGGNMDYNALVEGTTVYLTANVPGALVYVGDGHAAQGDGELTGDALETSMDVAFSVELLRGQQIGGPRAESPDHLMSIGIAGDLQEALRNATSDMTRWLALEYKLNSAEVASVLGTAMRYDVADMVGTQVSVVARVPKALIATLKKGP